MADNYSLNISPTVRPSWARLMTSPNKRRTERMVRRPSRNFIFSAEIGTESVVMMCLIGKARQAVLRALPERMAWTKDQVHITRAVLLYQVHRLRDGTAGIHFIVHDDHIAIFDIADQGQCFGFGIISRRAAFR